MQNDLLMQRSEMAMSDKLMLEQTVSAPDFLKGIDIVDAHHHFLQHQQFPYHWLAPHTGPGRFGCKELLRREYLPGQYLEDFSGTSISSSVHVQANCGAEDPAAETRWLQALKDETGWPSAIVAEADLMDPNASELIARHRDNSALRGIRTPVAWDTRGRWRVASQPGVMANARFQHMLTVLQAHSLALDLVIVPEQFFELTAMARKHPDQIIVINHFATLEPDEPGNADTWKKGISTLADLPNVYVKLSGLWTVDKHWAPTRLQPFVDHLLDTVGPSRVMYGSNLPVEAVNCSLARQVSQLEIILSGYSNDELQQLFSRTAKRVYQLA